MGLTVTNAQISIQDGPGVPVNLTSGSSVGLFTPGADVVFALQSTAGIARAEYQLICPAYPGLHQKTFTWLQGMSNGWTVTMPASTEVINLSTAAGILVQVTVTDSVSSIANSFNYLQSKGGNASEVQIAGIDYVMALALPAYTNTSGTLVGNANGAITSSMADGQTPAVGDTFLLPPGRAASAGDVGLYTITAVGSAGAKFTAVQAAAWKNGNFVLAKTEVLIARGTLYGGTTWVVTNTGINAIGSTSFTLYPRSVSQTVTLVLGTLTITNVPILSVATQVLGVRVSASGVALTIMYNPLTQPTPGALGTGSANIQASVAAGTVNTADVSVLTVTIFNQV